MARITRIAAAMLLGFAGWATATPAFSTDATVPEAYDFHSLQQEMQTRKLPLLLAFRADYCGFCKQLETEYLEPMVNSGKYDSRILIRRFSMGNDHTITDFNGDTMDADEFAYRHKASLTPTLLFLNAEGEEVAERLLGYNSPDFYGAYLENAIETARKAVGDGG